MNSSVLAGSRTGTHLSAGSTMGKSALSHTGVNNSAFTSARLGSSTRFGHTAFSRSAFGHPFGGSRFNRGFFNDHDFDDFGFRCFGCGFGFGFGPGFGFGFGWGWGGWWNPWWWNPWWWGPSPGWGWTAPAPLAPVSGDFSLYYGNSNSAYNAPYNNPSTGYGGPNSLNTSLNSEPVGSPNTNPLTGNVADSTPTILLYLKDGTMLAASDYWIADNKLHYLVNYGGENTVEMNEIDLQRTVDQNAKNGVKFWLKPNPNRTTAVRVPERSSPFSASDSDWATAAA
jgi:hypothetical protein